MNKFFPSLIFLFFSFISCSKKEGFCKYCEISNEIINDFLNEAKEKHEFSVVGKGGGYADNVNLIKIILMTNKKLTIEESRYTIKKLADDLLKKINANKKIRPYLSHYPFSYSGLHISISCTDREYNYLDDSEVSNILLKNNEITFSVKDPTNFSRIIRRESLR